MWRLLLSWVLLCSSVYAANDVIAVSSFVGKPTEIGQEIAETLGTDLAKSDRLVLVERSQLDKALRELRLQSSGLTEPNQARRVGRLVGADAVIVGSFYLRGQQIVINARLVDVRTARVAPGRAENVQGNISDLYNLLGDLANRLHLRLTGMELGALETTGKIPSTRSRPTVIDVQDEDILWVVQNGWMLGTPDGYFLPDRPLTVGDFARVLSRFKTYRSWEGKLEFDLSRPGDLMNALRAVVVLTRLALPPERFVQQPHTEGELLLLPVWARPYVYHALQQGYIRNVGEASPLLVMKRATLAQLLARVAPPPPGVRFASLPSGSLPNAPQVYTGLVVDARGQRMRPSANPELVDENGRRIYPDPQRLPTLDYILEHGVADFVKMEQQSQRAGDNPVYVKAVRVQGPARDKVVIRAEDAERVFQAEKQSGFLKRWRVVFLVD